MSTGDASAARRGVGNDRGLSDRALGEEMTTAVMSGGLQTVPSFSIENDRPAARLQHAATGVVAVPGRALFVLAPGLALLLLAYAGQDVRAETPQFEPPSQVLASNAGNRGREASEPAVLAARTQASVFEEDTQALAVDGTRSEFGADLPNASLPQAEVTTSRLGLAAGAMLMLEDSELGGIFDRRSLPRPARAADTDNPMQPIPLGIRLAADQAKQPAGGLPARAWSMGFSGTKLFKDDDRATLLVYLPMRNSKVVRKVVGTIFQSDDCGSLASDLQAMSLIARKRINTEFGYATQINKYSRFDASAVFRLNAHSDTGKSDLLLGLSYRLEF